MPKISRRLIIWLIVLAVVIAVFFTLMSPGSKNVSLSSSELITDLQQGIDPAGGNYTRADLTIKDTSLTAVIYSRGKELQTSIPSTHAWELVAKEYQASIPSNFDAFQVFASQIANGTVTINYQGATWWKNWGIIVVTGVASFLIGILGGYFWRRQRQA